jgi:exodeoxyribonuclease X
VHGDPFRRSEVLVVAHNAKFDFPIIAPFCGLATRLCTLELAWAIYPEAPNHKLNTLANFCAIDKVPNHRALDDIETCFALLQHFAKKTNNSLLELLEFSQDFEAISIMPFGKHKGSAIKDLPNDYKKWLFENFESNDWIIQVLKS